MKQIDPIGKRSVDGQDRNFNVDGVKKGIAEVSEVYRFLGAKDKLEVRYPESQHDFPPEVRMKAYRFINKILGFIPSR